VDLFLQVGIATERSELPLSALEWNAIVAAAPTDTIFLSYEWFAAWWGVFGAAHQLYFVWVKEQGQIVAFAPLMLTVEPAGLRKLEFAGCSNADYLDFCYAHDRPELLNAMLELLHKRSADWDVLRVANLPIHSVTFQHLVLFARRLGMRSLHEATVPCPTLMLKDRADEVRNLINKYSVRRKITWFEKRGRLTIEHHTDRTIIETKLNDFFAQHTQRWHMRRGKSQFENPEQRELFRRLVENLAPRGALLFTVVTLDAVPLAYHFGFDDGARLLWYKPSFNTEYAGHSPGVVLMKGLIEEALRRGKEEFDYTVGAEAFKYRFSNAGRANAYINLYHTRSRYSWALLLHALRAAARSILRLVRTALNKPLFGES
jgi:CelD/BcsL family acetyltransferase involved in cellulose biosynthesis